MAEKSFLRRKVGGGNMGNNETEKADDRESLKVMGVGGFCISSLSHFLGLAILAVALIPLLFSPALQAPVFAYTIFCLFILSLMGAVLIIKNLCMASKQDANLATTVNTDNRKQPPKIVNEWGLSSGLPFWRDIMGEEKGYEQS